MIATDEMRALHQKFWERLSTVGLSESDDELLERYCAAVDDIIARLDAKPADEPRCHDCGLPYGDDGFPDLVLPNEAWDLISPTGGPAGLLCPNCICRRAAQTGLTCQAEFHSGAFCIPPDETKPADEMVERAAQYISEVLFKRKWPAREGTCRPDFDPWTGGIVMNARIDDYRQAARDIFAFAALSAGEKG